MPQPFPLNKDRLEDLARIYPTPFYLYDEGAILSGVQKLLKAFSWNQGFKEYFAVKATPNPFLMKSLSRAGLGMDCSSLAELELSALCGVSGEQIMLTSNNTTNTEYQRAQELGAIINLDDITHLPYLKDHCELPSLLSFRLNPGSKLAGSAIIGIPEEAKFGLTEAQLFDAYEWAVANGVTRFGLHTMPISNELNRPAFSQAVLMLLDVAEELEKRSGINLEFINMGGGIGIPYRPEEDVVDIEKLSAEIKEVFVSRTVSTHREGLKLFMECGRYITGPYGYLVTRAIHKKETYRNYIGVDGSMANLMRPGMYDAYHHITVIGKEDHAAVGLFDVVGSLCENNDKFAVQRELPKIENGDFLVLHDAGAHGHSMGFNYNGKTRSAELLLRTDGSIVQIRRAETLDDHFATLNLKQVSNFE